MISILYFLGIRFIFWLVLSDDLFITILLYLNAIKEREKLVD